MSIYDVSGRLLETLADGWQESGVYEVQWHREEQRSGVYFCKLQASDLTDMKKMMLLR